MKKHITILLLTLSLSIQAQISKESNHTHKLVDASFNDDQINSFIKEVYGEHATVLFFQNKERFKAIKRFFSKARIIYNANDNIKKAYPNTLNLKLNKSYNKSLKHDTNLSNYKTFNPLKYNIEMFPKARKTYRIANTHYLLVINPQK